MFRELVDQLRAPEIINKMYYLMPLKDMRLQSLFHLKEVVVIQNYKIRKFLKNIFSPY